ncbi:phage major capsid protein [Cryocola sp. 340MFSha3.1]|uniref:phage major capsid protein n=1 Tax=Cryocola sp. 340MFSha3.1 TaxID=1169145 RepID=UPI00036BDF19|nr:phage major capsid protein [Cryocola sp. 340MFSha3.1]
MPNSPTLSIFNTHEAGPLIIEPLQAASLAIQLTTNVETEGNDYRIPVITDDPSAAWLNENEEIPLSEQAADQEIVTPAKVAGLSVISNELANDTHPEAHALIGEGLARDIGRKVDAAFFGPVPSAGSPQPRGLTAVQGVQVITADPAAGTDAFVDALAAAESAGSTVDAWVTDPATAKALAKLKQGQGSNLPLFGTGAANGIQRDVLGVPLHVCQYMTPGTAWGIPKARTFTVLRQDVTIDVDRSRYFEFDQTAIRAVLRIGYGFPHAEALVKIQATTK